MSLSRGSLFVALLVGAVGCALKPPRSMEMDADQAPLASTAPLKHLHQALDADAKAEINTVADLLRAGPDVFASAPDPSAWFEAEQARLARMPALEQAMPLRVLTYNIALLDRKYMGTTVTMPEIDARRPVMGDRLFKMGYDILLLQEVWEWSDVEALQRAGEAAGYVVYGGSPTLHPEHGLAIAVRKEIIDEEQPQDRREQQFMAQRKLEYFPGPDIKRGWLTWSFTLAGADRRVHLYDLHATSFVVYWRQRELQARQVGAEIRERPREDVVILGGDFNSGPYYRDDVWMDGDNKKVPDWWRNAVAYPLWLHYGQLTDVLNATEVPQDVNLGNTIPRLDDYSALLTVPAGDERWCGLSEGVVFTASDCNSLYFKSYGGTEPPARLDYLFLRDPSGAVRVSEANLVLDEPQSFDDRQHELSDHYGVEALLKVALPFPEEESSP
ncbi:MAG: endonuclease/exonuclease/phosphatase family protein [Myxococcota bacterium]